MSDEVPPLGADELYDKALEMMQAARGMMARAQAGSSSASSPDHMDFDALPGRTAESRAEALYGGRLIRNRMFPADLFGEPAWDILLQLFLAEKKGVVLPCSAVKRGASISAETGDRWLALLQTMNLVIRSNPIGDDNAATVKLAPEGLERMTRFFEITEGRRHEVQGNRHRLRVISSKNEI